MQTVLVTGNAGYIGGVLTPMLVNEGYRVIGVDNLMHGPSALLGQLGLPNFEFHKLDVRGDDWLKTLLPQADFVVPLAAIVGEPLAKTKPRATGDINTIAVSRLMEVLGDGQKVVLPNTNSGYGKVPNRMVTETDRLWPVSDYGRSKVEAEMHVLERENSCSFRLGTAFGTSPRTRLDLLLNDFVYQLFRVKGNKKKELVLYQPDFKRSFVGVRDAARAFIWALKNDIRGVYNLNLPESLSKMKLAQTVCSALGMEPSVIRVGEGKDPDKRDYAVSPEKVLSAGFSFTQSVEDGIREILTVCETFTFPQLQDMRNF